MSTSHVRTGCGLQSEDQAGVSEVKLGGPGWCGDGEIWMARARLCQVAATVVAVSFAHAHRRPTTVRILTSAPLFLLPTCNWAGGWVKWDRLAGARGAGGTRADQALGHNVAVASLAHMHKGV